MPTDESHLALARDNQATLDYLLQDEDRHSAWVASVAFYKALHLVEALFFHDLKIKHSGDHKNRQKYMKRSDYESIFRDYKHLVEASYVARYLEAKTQTGVTKKYGTFSDFATPETVRTQLVAERLDRIEKEVNRRLKQLAPAVLQAASPADDRTHQP
jgi:N-glycosylase/DNA lyase